MAYSKEIKDQVSQLIQALDWSIDTGDDERREQQWGREVVSGVYQDYRLSVIFDSKGEPEKVEIFFEDSVVDHERRRWTRRSWYGMESLPSPEQAIQMLWGR